MKKGSSEKSPANPLPQRALDRSCWKGRPTVTQVTCEAGFPEAGPRLREACRAPSGPPKAGSQERVNYFSLPAPPLETDHRHKPMLHLRKVDSAACVKIPCSLQHGFLSADLKSAGGMV